MNASLGPEAIEKKVREIKEKYETERAQKSEQQLVLERDLRKAIDHINLLEAGQAGLVKEKSASEMALARLRQSSIQAQARHEATLALNDQSLAQLKKAHQTTLDALQTQLAWLENENKRLIQAAQEPVLPSPPALADLERQKQELQLLLKDAQADNKLLRHQERIAKSELRKLNTADKKQNMNTEYLKNVLLKFLMSENKQPSC
ncbi:hypothetical protein BY458DRAFT_324867 [Sporodiniella umbellata]|nr:hypothetical protein BY458DRAFT_324867 [Sporodiniella umbellata]